MLKELTSFAQGAVGTALEAEQLIAAERGILPLDDLSDEGI